MTLFEIQNECEKLEKWDTFQKSVKFAIKISLKNCKILENYLKILIGGHERKKF